jgi:oligoendopeptidase F
MALHPSESAASIRWDLSDLYTSTDDPNLDKDLKIVEESAAALSSEYRGRIEKLNGTELSSFLSQYEACLEQIGKISTFAHLSWSTDTGNPQRGALLQKLTERSARLHQILLFFDLEWTSLTDDQAQSFLSDERLSNYRHFLLVTRRTKPHLLSEPEERLLSEKSITGKSSWARYFDQMHAAAIYQIDGAEIQREELLNKLHQSDRSLRHRSAAALTDGLRTVMPSSTFVFNTLLADKAVDDTLRQLPTWISDRNLDNQVNDAVVEALVAAVVSRYDIVERYYRLKRRLLDVDELFDYDRYAPLAAGSKRYTWEEAVQTVLSSYEGFSRLLSEAGAQFFENAWIDAPIQPGKRGGAFCHPSVPSHHPYLLMNYAGQPRDVMTLAHELGHGVHALLSAPKGYLQFHTPLTTAETASVFGEMLVFRNLMEQENNRYEKLAMLVRRIEDTFATVFRQTAMNRFEQAIHEARRNDGELSNERFSELWLATQRSMFGDSVTLTENYGAWWSYIPHFIHTPGYVYAYSFGELLVLALYARYEEVGSSFADLYLEMLRAGGSDWPHQIMKPLGVDLNDPTFWNYGLRIIEQMVDQAEELAP